MIKAEVIADSMGPFGDRLTTLVVTFPRIILSEFNTHRMFSRNSASSRAIPFNKMIRMINEDPFIPIAWQKEHTGMQGTEYWTVEEIGPTESSMLLTEAMKNQWLVMRNNAMLEASVLSRMGATKQVCNRLLEPFMWHTAIVSATEWENFFKLRCPQYVIDGPWKSPYTFRSKKDAIKSHQVVEYTKNWTDIDWLKANEGQAEIHIMALAEAMWDAMNESTPVQLLPGDWHIPFGDKMDEQKILGTFDKLNPFAAIILKSDDLKRAKLEIATARCARVSYLNYEGKDDYEADFRLYKKLLGPPPHLSPFEHCSQVMGEEEYYSNVKGEYPVILPQEGDTDGIVLRELYPQSYTKGEHKDLYGWCKNFRGFTQLRHFVEQ